MDWAGSCVECAYLQVPYGVAVLNISGVVALFRIIGRAEVVNVRDMGLEL